MPSWSAAQARGLVVLLILLCAGLCVGFWKRGRAVEQGFVITGQAGMTETRAAMPSGLSPSSRPAATFAPSRPEPPAHLYVHVAGAVRRPGVYCLPPGARADDALQEACGAKPNANTDAVNLAARLEDGQQLYIPTRTEQPTGGATASVSGGAGGGASSRPAAAPGGKLTTPGQGTINLNTANAEDLQRLPGIGPSYAARILQFRQENGPFTSVDQLLDVSGIGPKKLEAMRPFVTIGASKAR